MIGTFEYNQLMQVTCTCRDPPINVSYWYASSLCHLWQTGGPWGRPFPQVRPAEAPRLDILFRLTFLQEGATTYLELFSQKKYKRIKFIE